MEQAGLVLAAVAGLWIVYLVPQLLRHRRQLAEARVDDRFSEHLRVLRVAELSPHRRGRTPRRKAGCSCTREEGTGRCTDRSPSQTGSAPTAPT